MGQTASQTRTINIDNPDPPDTRLSNLSGSRESSKRVSKVVAKNTPEKRLALLPKFSSAEEHIGDLRSSLLKAHLSNSAATAINMGKEEFDRMYQDVERYFTFTTEHTLRDYEVPCKTIKAALKECLSLNSDTPLRCGEEVSDFVTCLLKCKMSPQI